MACRMQVFWQVFCHAPAVLLHSGTVPLERIGQAIVQHSNTCGMHHFPLTLGACLLNGCGMGSMDRQEALTLVQRWRQTVGSGDTPWDDSRLGALEGLAPEYQPLSQLSPWLERLKPLQQKDMNRMRGLVQLGTAYATLGHPV